VHPKRRKRGFITKSHCISFSNIPFLPCTHLTFAICIPLLYLHPSRSTKQIKGHKVIFETTIFAFLGALGQKQSPSQGWKALSTLQGDHCVCPVVMSRRRKKQARAWLCQSIYRLCQSIYNAHYNILMTHGEDTWQSGSSPQQSRLLCSGEEPDPYLIEAAQTAGTPSRSEYGKA